jgi:hypothetical protein
VRRRLRAAVGTAVLVVHSLVPTGAGWAVQGHSALPAGPVAQVPEAPTSGPMPATVSATQEQSSLPDGVLAQVSVNPTSGGMPGGELAQQLLNWTSQVALWGSLTSLLVGAMVWGLSQHMGNGMHAGRGRTFAMAGAVGALLAGLAPTIINTLFGAAG